MKCVYLQKKDEDMKQLHHMVCMLCLAAVVGCGKGEEKVQTSKQGETTLTAHQELQQAMSKHEQFIKEKDKSALYEAEYHYANVAIRDDANDTLRVNALFNLHAIEYHGAYGRTNYAKALMYINRCIEYAEAGYVNSTGLALFYAHKGDDLWHYGETDSAIHYCHKAMSIPVRTNGTDYIIAYVLKHVYEERNMPDSAAYYEQRFRQTGQLPANQLNRHNIHAPLSDSELEAELKRTMEESKLLKETTPKGSSPKAEEKEALSNDTIDLTLPLCIVLLAALALYLYNKRRKTSATPEQQSPVEEEQPSATDEERKETFALPESLVLRRSLAEGKRTFESTASYDDLNTMQIKEKELYDMAFEATRDVESTLFTSFKEACSTLIESAELNDQELICCFCTFMGYTNNVIAYIGHTTPATIRKRKDRIKKKLPADFCDIIFGSKG